MHPMAGWLGQDCHAASLTKRVDELVLAISSDFIRPTLDLDRSDGLRFPKKDAWLAEIPKRSAGWAV
jgi:hypothetical protein